MNGILGILPDDAYVVIRPSPSGLRYIRGGDWCDRLATAQIFGTLEEAERAASQYDGSCATALQLVDHLHKGRLRWKGYVRGVLYRIEHSPEGDVIRVYDTSKSRWELPKSPPILPSSMHLIYETFLTSFNRRVPEVVSIDFTSPFLEHDVRDRWPTYRLRRLADPYHMWLLDRGQVKVVLHHKSSHATTEVEP